MRFRPCIDILGGKVRQIVGASLDFSGLAEENFVTDESAEKFAQIFKKYDLADGHVVILDVPGSRGYELSKAEALKALAAYDGGMMVGGGITHQNAGEFLFDGANKIIMTSFVFHDGKIDLIRLKRMCDVYGPQRICLDLSCKKKDGEYFVVTDHWTHFTDAKISMDLFGQLSKYCGEFLIHAADVEGQGKGIDEPLLQILSEWDGVPITYAGGVANTDDIRRVKDIGKDRIDLTVGSALKIYGGSMEIDEILEAMK